MPARPESQPAQSPAAPARPSGSDRRASLRERQAELRRNYLLDAAEEAFASAGFEGATMREIAAAAGFSPAAVYTMFESKDTLFAAIMDRHAQVLLKLHQDAIASDGSVEERLHRMVDRKLDYHMAHQEFSRLYQKSIGMSMLRIESLDSTSYRRFHETMDVMAALFRQGVESGVMYPGDPKHLTMLFSGMIEGHLARALFEVPETDSARQLLHDAVTRAFVKPAVRSPA
jgi:AcrR family transcriptional regulator